MELLKERIRRDGKVKGTDVLKVDSFLNHQMDIKLFAEIGREFKRRFADCQINKILTIEASGIGIACITAQYFDCPVIFAKKSQTKNIAGEVYTAKVESFTHGRVYDIIVAKEFLGPGVQAGGGRRRHSGRGRHRHRESLPARRRHDPRPRHPAGVPGPRQVHE